MVSFTNNVGYGVCLSNDEKPASGVKNGDVLLEMDTGKTYMFDEENTRWIEWAGAGEGDGESAG